MRKQKDKYKEPKTINFPGMVARVYLPILEPKDREERIEKLRKATAYIMST